MLASIMVVSIVIYYSFRRDLKFLKVLNQPIFFSTELVSAQRLSASFPFHMFCSVINLAFLLGMFLLFSSFIKQVF